MIPAEGRTVPAAAKAASATAGEERRNSKSGGLPRAAAKNPAPESLIPHLTRRTATIVKIAVRASRATTAVAVGKRTRHARRRALRAGNSLTSGHIDRTAKGLEKRAIGPGAIGRLLPGREESASMAIGRIAVRKSHGKSASIVIVISGEVSTSREDSASPATTDHAKRTVVMSGRDLRAGAKTVHFAMLRLLSVSDLIAHVSVPSVAPTGTSIRAAKNDRSPAMRRGRAAATRTRAERSQSVRRSAAAGLIVNAISRSDARLVLRKREKPANASPRSWRGRDLLRAATPKSGSCRGASRSTAV